MNTHQWQWLIRSGLVRADGLGRKAKLRRCICCRDHIVQGLDGDVCAVVVSVQPGPVDRHGELLALWQGRRTFHLIPILNSPTFPAFHLVERSAASIKRNSLWDILVEHRCHDPIPTVPSKLYRETPEDPPF